MSNNVNNTKPATVEVYCAGELYSGGNAVINDLKTSGFNTVIAWAVHVTPSGDLVYNDPPIITGGKYVGPAGWPEQLASLKTGATSVDRLIFSVGGWGVGDFPNIKALIEKDGIGSDTALYKSFKALKDAIPTIDAIDFDDETTYDHNTTVQFSLMLHAIGFEVTYCPYTAQNFWIDCLYAVEQQVPGLVTAFNLQCYSGGAGNNPETWIQAIQTKMGTDFDANDFVIPGLACMHNTPNGGQGMCPSKMTSTLEGWNQGENNLKGGFVWRYAHISQGDCSGTVTTADYATAVKKALNVESAWIKVSNVAEYKGASWNNLVKKTTSTTVEAAKEYAASDANITFFFFARESVILEPHGTIEANTAVFFSGQPWYGGATSCDAYQKVTWTKVDNVAEYKGASWDDLVKKTPSTTVAEAKLAAEADDSITYFFYATEGVVLEPHGLIEANTAVFFSGQPWYGETAACDAYQKS